ncbi:hypothetical protein [Altererythrobacter sp. MF3-039]|uniref:hypothetical protein n=1 Tax=Altererythrobacter sp. MF3-039 TaxID=3252901 RepID=UPI00390C926E
MLFGRMSRDGQMRVADLAFGAMAIFGSVGLIFDSFDDSPKIPNAPEPLLTGISVVGLMLLVGLIVTKLAALDRHNGEEYTFQLLANGAVISVMTTMVVTLLWTSDFLLARWLGEPSSSQLIALLMGSWSVGYFTYRIRGVRE